MATVQPTTTTGRAVRLLRYQEPPFWITILFLLFVWSKYIQATARVGALAAIRLEFVLGTALIIMCVVQLIYNPVDLKRSRPVIVGITLLFVAMIVQIPVAASQVVAQKIFVDRVVKFAFLTFFMATLINSPRALRWFIAVFLLSCFWITQESVRGLISGGLVWQNQGIMRLHGAVPIYHHPNSLGGVAMGVVPFVVFLWPVVHKKLVRLALLAMLVSALVCVIYSGSRTAYVALFSFFLFWWFRSPRKVKFLVYTAVALPIIVAIMPSEYLGRLQSITGQEAEGHSKDARVTILEDAWIVFTENPAGVGLGCFPVVRRQRFGRLQDTHNLYLEVATNIGIQGLVIFLAFVTIMLRGYMRSYRSFAAQRRALLKVMRSMRAPPGKVLRSHLDDLQLLKAVAEAAGGFIVVRLVLGLFGMDLYEVYWWFGAGLSICLLNMTVSTERRTGTMIAALQARE